MKPIKPLSVVLCTAFAATLPLMAEDVQGLVIPITQVSVSSPVLQDVITEVLVKEGDTVKEGQVLVQLRSDREELLVQRTQKQIELAESRMRGTEALLKDKITSKDKALEERTNYELAQILNREAQVAFKEKTIRSPISGIVVKKHKEAGESVDRVEKLIDVVNIDQVYVQFFLDQKLMGSVVVDQPATVRFPILANKEFSGKVTFIDPRIEVTTGNSFRVKVLIDNADHQIKAGMRGLADFAKR